MNKNERHVSLINNDCKNLSCKKVFEEFMRESVVSLIPMKTILMI